MTAGLMLEDQFQQAPGRPFAEIVVRQPELLSEALPRLRRDVSERAPRLASEEPVAFVGIGASRSASWHAAWELLRAGRWAQRFTGEELGAGPVFDALYVGVSQSGRSPEPLRALQELANRRRVTVTNEPRAPLAKVGDPAFLLGELPDSGVSTIGYTATAAVLSMLAEQWTTGSVSESWDALGEALRATIDREADRLQSRAEVLAGAQSIDVVGGGPWFGVAEACALVIREALHVPAAAFDTRSYLHGQTDSVSRAGAQILLGGERESILEAELAGRSLCVVRLEDAMAPGSQSRAIGLPGATTGQRTLAAAAVLHELVRRWGTVTGVDPDEPVFERLDTKAAG